MTVSIEAPTIASNKTSVRFIVHPQEVRVESDDDTVHKMIRKYLSYIHPNVRYIRASKLKEARAKGDAEKEKYWRDWDGGISLYKSNRFSIGFLWRVKMMVKHGNYSLSVEDLRNKPFPLPHHATPKFMGILRPYQEDALKRMLKVDNGIVDMGTGAGKTVVALALIAKRACPTFVIVPTVPLVNEWLYKAKEFLRFSDDEKYVGFASGKQCQLSVINIINIHTLFRCLFKSSKHKQTMERYRTVQNAYYNADMLMVDECHHSSTDTWKACIMQSDAFYRYGFTATADMRHDMADLEYYGLLGEKIIRVSPHQLVSEGYIAKARVIFHEWGQCYFRRPQKFAGPQGVEDLGIVFNHRRNTVIVDNTFEAWAGQKRRVLIMCRRLDHGALLKDLIIEKYRNSPISKQRDCAVDWVHGKSKNKEEIITDFREGKIDILITQNQLLSEGVDIPDIACVVMAAGGKSTIKTIQSIGRGVRLAKGKTDLLVHDYADRGLYITEHAEKRLKTYANETAFVIDTKGTFLEGIAEYLKEMGSIVAD